MTSILNTEIEKPVVTLDPECVDTYGLKPCMPEYLTRMRALVRAYGWDLKEIFEKDDPLEWGSVSEHVFRCVMNQKFAGPCGFSNEVVDAIIDFFRTPDGHVFYGRIHELMIQDDNMANRLRLCAEDVAMPMTSTMPLRYCGKPVFSTDPPVPCILERLRTAYFRLGVRIADLFKCCDPECSGLVDEDTFKCMLNEQLVPESGITPIQLQAIANFYRACGNKIDYKRMDSMFESTLGIQEQIQMDFITSKEELKIPKCVKTLCDSEEIRLNEVLCTIVTRANKKYLTSLSSIFHKFAQKPTGETTVPHLRRFFEYIQTSIAESDFSLICKKYTVSGYNIHFLALIEDLDDKFHKHMCPKTLAAPYGAYTASPDIRRSIPKGAWIHDEAFKPGKCNCAGESEAVIGGDPNAVIDGSRFYEGGPVVGGSGKPLVFGSDYLHKRAGATLGQGFAGTPEHDPAAGKPSKQEYEKCENSDEGYKARMRDCESRMVNLVDVKERVQQYVYKFQLRVKMFFKQYDRLNSGYILASEFRTALNDMGTSNLGKLDLEETEIDALINFYRLPDEPNLVCWRKFESDIDSVFFQRGIEKDPMALTPNVDRIIKLPGKGSVDFDTLPDKFKRLACCAFTKLKSRVTLERCSLQYFFRGCDRKNSGYVTKEQFESVLTAIHFIMSESEKDALFMKYSDDKGFYYRRLVRDLEPPAEECLWYKKYVAGRLWRQQHLGPPPPKWVEHDVQRIMYKLQSRMVRNRPRLSNFLKDHDNPHHDRIKIWDFHRAMDRAGFELTPQEIETLVCCFRSPEDPAEIEWRCFSDAVETCFTVPELEKAPRFTPGSWRPLKEMDYDKLLSKEEYCELNEGMRRLARETRNRNLAMKPILTDFDYPHTGLVSQDQIHRVLHTFGLANMVTPKELNAIFKRYRVVRGNKNDFDYVEFLANLDGISSMDPIKLEEMSPTGVRWVKQLNSCCI